VPFAEIRIAIRGKISFPGSGDRNLEANVRKSWWTSFPEFRINSISLSRVMRALAPNLKERLFFCSKGGRHCVQSSNCRFKVKLGNQLFAAFTAARAQDPASAVSFHSGTETMNLFSASYMRLKSAFWHDHSPSLILKLLEYHKTQITVNIQFTPQEPRLRGTEFQLSLE
jgi:hypothetical protein